MGEDQSHFPELVLDELREALRNIGFPECGSLVLYGLEFTHLFDTLEYWLEGNQSRILIFFEDDLGKINAFLKEKHSFQVLRHPRVFFIYLTEHWEEKGDNVFEKGKPFLIHLTQDWKFAAAKPSPLSFTLESKLIPYVFALKLFIWDSHRALCEKNFYKNLPHLTECFSTKSLSPLPSRFPLFISGAGPSIRKELNFLEKVVPKGILLGSGTGMNILNQAALESHLGIGLDPSCVEGEKIRSQTVFSTPFFIDLNMSFEGMDFLHGPLFLVRQTGYAKWKNDLLELLGIKDILKISWCTTSTQFAAEVATALQASTIFYLGIDMAFPGKKRYGGDEGWGKDSQTPLPRDLIVVKSFQGTSILSSKNFLIESTNLAKIARNHPDISYYYTSLDGLGVMGVPTVDFKSAWAEQEIPSFDVENELHALLFLQPLLGISLKTIKKVVKEWKDSIDGAKESLRLFLSKEGNTDNIETEWSSLLCFHLIHSFIQAIELRLEVRRRNLLITTASREDRAKKERFLTKEKYRQLFEQLSYHSRICGEVLEELQEEWSENGNLSSCPEVKIEAPTSPPKEGKWIRFYQNGKKRAQQTYRKGILEGDSLFFSPEGHPLAEASFEKGLKTGIAKQYYRNGALYSFQEWKNGKKEGLHTYYFENGILKALLPYKMGYLEGVVRVYRRNGTLKQEAIFEKGLREGVSRSFCSKGIALQEDLYKKGILQKGAGNIFDIKEKIDLMLGE